MWNKAPRWQMSFQALWLKESRFVLEISSLRPRSSRQRKRKKPPQMRRPQQRVRLRMLLHRMPRPLTLQPWTQAPQIRLVAEGWLLLPLKLPQATLLPCRPIHLVPHRPPQLLSRPLCLIRSARNSPLVLSLLFNHSQYFSILFS